MPLASTNIQCNGTETAYQITLPLVTADEIDAYFQQDLSRYGTLVDQYNFEKQHSKQFLKTT